MEETTEEIICISSADEDEDEDGDDISIISISSDDEWDIISVSSVSVSSNDDQDDNDTYQSEIDYYYEIDNWPVEFQKVSKMYISNNLT